MITFIIKRIKLWFLLNFLISFWGQFDKIKIKMANSGQELHKIFNLRWKAYIEEGYIEPKDFPNRELKDQYEKNSLNLLALKNNIPIGTVRFIFPSDHGFPTEKAFNLKNLNFPKKEIGEISKLCIERKYRKTKIGEKIFLSLMAEIYKFMKKNKMKYVLIGVPHSLKRAFEPLDFQSSIVELQAGPLKPENIKERKTAHKYFENFKVTPYLITIT